MSLAAPEWLLLFPPLLLLWWSWFWPARRTRWSRLLLLALCVLALAEPQVAGHAPGATLVLLVDRSASVKGEALARARALGPELEGAVRRHGGEQYVIGFGRGAGLLAAPGESLEHLSRLPEQDESDLAAGLRLAAAHAKPNAATEVLVISDGVYTIDDPRLQAASLRARGIRLHALEVGTFAGADTAITRVVTPARTARGQRFNVAVEVQSPRAQSARLRLLDAAGRTLADQHLELAAGTRRYALALAADETGVQAFDVALDVDADPRPGNNRAHAVVDVLGAPRVLLYNAGATDTALRRALETAGLAIELRDPRTPLTLAALQGASALVLENVGLNELGEGADAAIANYVEHMGGGLLITGGRSSYAMGGYFRSALEPIVPVSMDRQEELRRPRLDMAIALDRSGSMAMPAQNGVQKMDLADRAAAEAIGLLAPGDGVMVLAVDTAAHVVHPLQRIASAKDREAVRADVMSVESSGGGIYVYTALAAAMDGLLEGSAPTRHIVLFSDAADSEEPGNYRPLVTRWREAGGTLSVIGLGTPSDPDAALLREIAELGGGRVYFTNDALQLPRVFAQDVMYMVRKTFLERETRVLGGRGLLSIGLHASADAIPSVAGYNLTFLRDGAETVLVSDDENHAPLAATWQRGTGKVAAVTFEADGPFTGNLATWSDYKPFFRSLLEWIKRPEAPSDIDADLHAEGRLATLDVQLPPDHRGDVPTHAWVMAPNDPQPRNVALSWTGPNTLQASFPIESGGIYQAALDVPGASPIALPPITLPYSPEFDLRSGADSGQDVLTQLAHATGGGTFTRVEDLYAARPALSDARRSLLPWIAAALLALVLFDIAHRRGLLDPQLARAQSAFARTRGLGARLRDAARAASTAAGGTRASSAATSADPADASSAAHADPANAATETPVTAQPAENALKLAKRRARRR